MKYEVSTFDFGKTLKGPVYFTHEALEKTFGKLPSKIRLIVEEAE